MLKKILIGLGVLGGAGLLLAVRAQATPPKRRPVRFPVLVVGDSIGVGVAQALGAQNLAVVGERTRTTLDKIRTNLRAASTTRTVVLSTGTNNLDQSTEQIIRLVGEIIDVCRVQGKRVVVLGPPPAYQALNETDQEALWHLRLALGVFKDYVDIWQIVGNPYNAGHYLEEFGAPDGLHARFSGYRKIAQALRDGEL